MRKCVRGEVGSQGDTQHINKDVLEKGRNEWQSQGWQFEVGGKVVVMGPQRVLCRSMKGPRVLPWGCGQLKDFVGICGLLGVARTRCKLGDGGDDDGGGGERNDPFSTMEPHRKRAINSAQDQHATTGARRGATVVVLDQTLLYVGTVCDDPVQTHPQWFPDDAPSLRFFFRALVVEPCF